MNQHQLYRPEASTSPVSLNIPSKDVNTKACIIPNRFQETEDYKRVLQDIADNKYPFYLQAVVAVKTILNKYKNKINVCS